MPTLDWIGKKAVVNHHQEVPYRLIHCNGVLSVGDPDAGNLLIEGDNLVALKALLPYYAGKVKCIYIDPPFNTGSEEWHYNDNVTSPEISRWLKEVVGKEADDLCRHDKWLCMMYPRLRVLREFLCKEGTLFVHIDDNEIAHAIILCDEIFGLRNRRYVVTFKQASATGHKSINPGCVNVTNNVLIYSKDRDHWKPNRVFTGRDRDKRYNQFIENRGDPFEQWRFTTLMKAFALSKGIPLKEARKLAKDDPKSLDDFVLINASSVVQPARPDYESVGQETRDAIDMSEKNPDQIFRIVRGDYSDIFLRGGMRLLFYSDKVKTIDGVPVAGEPLTTLWDDVLSNNLHQEGGVDFPKGKKPEALIKRCLDLATHPNDLVLDSFGGSGTTAAVALKMGRRWLSVETGEHAKTHIQPRLQSVVSGLDPSGVTKETRWIGGAGFRYCALGESLFDADGGISPTVTFPDLAAHVFFAETGQPLPKKAQDGNSFLGTFQNRAVYLLWSREGASKPGAYKHNILSVETLAALPSPGGEFLGERVVYADGCTASRERLNRDSILFKQVPYRLAGN